MILDVSSFKLKWSFLQDRKVFVGISGGVDSVVLFRLLVMCGFDVVALHVNYQLRGNESDKDEEFVRNLCKQLNVQLHVKKLHKCDVSSYISGGSRGWWWDDKKLKKR